MRNVAIVGLGHSKFGRRTDVNVAELAFESIKGAIEDSGVLKKDIQNVTVGSAGGWYEENLPAVIVNEYAGFQDVGTMRVEAACASGSRPPSVDAPGRLPIVPPSERPNQRPWLFNALNSIST